MRFLVLISFVLFICAAPVLAQDATPPAKTVIADDGDLEAELLLTPLLFTSHIAGMGHHDSYAFDAPMRITNDDGVYRLSGAQYYMSHGETETTSFYLILDGVVTHIRQGSFIADLTIQKFDHYSVSDSVVPPCTIKGRFEFARTEYYYPVWEINYKRYPELLCPIINSDIPKEVHESIIIALKLENTRKYALYLATTRYHGSTH